MENFRNFNTSVTAEIRAEAARQGLSHAGLTRRCGWTTGYLSRRMTGSIPWSTDEIDAIAQVLGIPTSQLTQPRQAS